MTESRLIYEKCLPHVPSLTMEQAEQLAAYYHLLIEKNEVMNLTAITEFEEVVRKHFLDSLMLSQAVPDLHKPLRVMDLGTGAGFPGIPLKIVYPELSVVLADSLQKRVLFLEEVIEKLSLRDITAVHGRAEDLGRSPEHREKYDLCVSRAVANMATLSEYCLPFVKPGGTFIAYKAQNAAEEAEKARKAVFLCAGKLKQVYEYLLPGEEQEEIMNRAFVVIEKTGPISKKYPRNAGKPAKQPLC